MTVSNNKKNLKKSNDEPNKTGYHFNYALMLATVSLVLLAIVFGFLYFIFFVEIKDLKSDLNSKLSKNAFFSDQNIAFETKEDGSKVTQIDKEISDYLEKELFKKYPNIKFFSEENRKNLVNLPNEKNFFLADPIDGTSSFIKKKKEFTINLSFPIDSSIARVFAWEWPGCSLGATDPILNLKLIFLLK